MRHVIEVKFRKCSGCNGCHYVTYNFFFFSLLLRSRLTRCHFRQRRRRLSAANRPQWAVRGSCQRIGKLRPQSASGVQIAQSLYKMLRAKSLSRNASGPFFFFFFFLSLFICAAQCPPRIKAQVTSCADGWCRAVAPLRLTHTNSRSPRKSKRYQITIF